MATLLALMPLRTPSLNSGPFPPPELPGFAGTTNPSATPDSPACPSRASGCGPLSRTAWGFPCCVGSPLRTCRRHYPGGIAGSDRSWDGLFQPFPSDPDDVGLPRSYGGSAPTLSLSRPAQRSLLVTACPIAGPLYGPFHRRLRRLRYLHRRSNCFRPERPSCRVGIAPTENPRLFTAHIAQGFSPGFEDMNRKDKLSPGGATEVHRATWFPSPLRGSVWVFPASRDLPRAEALGYDLPPLRG